MNFSSSSEILSKVKGINGLTAMSDRILESKSECPALVSTLNLQHLRLCSESEIFFSIYRDSELIIPDGLPIIWLSNFNGIRNLKRFPGVDLCLKILKSEEKVFVLGCRIETVNIVEKRFDIDSSKISGFYGLCPNDPSENLLEEIAGLINNFDPKFIILALGSPKQEYYYSFLKSRFTPSKLVFVGLGGSIDILSGKFSRAPAIFQRAGLEWAWRLSQSPRRLLPRYVRDGYFLIKFLYYLVRMRNPWENREY